MTDRLAACGLLSTGVACVTCTTAFAVHLAAAGHLCLFESNCIQSIRLARERAHTLSHTQHTRARTDNDTGQLGHSRRVAHQFLPFAIALTVSFHSAHSHTFTNLPFIYTTYNARVPTRNTYRDICMCGTYVHTPLWRTALFRTVNYYIENLFNGPVNGRTNTPHKYLVKVCAGAGTHALPAVAVPPTPPAAGVVG